MPILARSFVYNDAIKVSSEDLDLAVAGRKTCTIRLGTLSVARDRLLLTDGRRSLPICITAVEAARRFGDLTDDDARDEGLSGLDSLRLDLRRFYGEIEAQQPVTVIHFRLAS